MKCRVWMASTVILCQYDLEMETFSYLSRGSFPLTRLLALMYECHPDLWLPCWGGAKKEREFPLWEDNTASYYSGPPGLCSSLSPLFARPQKKDVRMLRFIQEVNTTTRSCALWDLDEDTEYIVHVQSISMGGSSPPSEPVLFRTPKESEKMASKSPGEGPERITLLFDLAHGIVDWFMIVACDHMWVWMTWWWLSFNCYNGSIHICVSFVNVVSMLRFLDKLMLIISDYSLFLTFEASDEVNILYGDFLIRVNFASSEYSRQRLSLHRKSLSFLS